MAAARTSPRNLITTSCGATAAIGRQAERSSAVVKLYFETIAGLSLLSCSNVSEFQRWEVAQDKDRRAALARTAEGGCPHVSINISKMYGIEPGAFRLPKRICEAHRPAVIRMTVVLGQDHRLLPPASLRGQHER